MRSDRVSVYSEYVSGAAKFAAVHLVLGSEVVVVIDLQRSIPAGCILRQDVREKTCTMLEMESPGQTEHQPLRPPAHETRNSQPAPSQQQQQQLQQQFPVYQSLQVRDLTALRRRQRVGISSLSKLKRTVENGSENIQSMLENRRSINGEESPQKARHVLGSRL